MADLRREVVQTDKMADVPRRPQLPPNYNINQMRLIYELKVAYPSLPDETIRLCLKKHGNNKSLCVAELTLLTGRCKSRHRNRFPERRFSVDAVSYSETIGRDNALPTPRPWTRRGYRRNSCCEELQAWSQVLTMVDTNRVATTQQQPLTNRIHSTQQQQANTNSGPEKRAAAGCADLHTKRGCHHFYSENPPSKFLRNEDRNNNNLVPNNNNKNNIVFSSNINKNTSSATNNASKQNDSNQVEPAELAELAILLGISPIQSGNLTALNDEAPCWPTEAILKSSCIEPCTSALHALSNDATVVREADDHADPGRDGRAVRGQDADRRGPEGGLEDDGPDGHKADVDGNFVDDAPGLCEQDCVDSGHGGLSVSEVSCPEGNMDIDMEVSGLVGGARRPRALALASELEPLPRVVLTPDSPPLDTMRPAVRTLYSPEDNSRGHDTSGMNMVRTNPAMIRRNFSAESFGTLYPLEERRESLDEEEEERLEDSIEDRMTDKVPVTLAFPTSVLRDSLCIKGMAGDTCQLLAAASSLESSPSSLIVCGNSCSITHTTIDIPGGWSTESQSLAAPTGPPIPLVTQHTTSVTQGTLHFMKDIGDGNISLATTTFCGIQSSVVSTSSRDRSPGRPSQCTTVIYTLNSRPIVCENPFRKVFARRQQFYQARERRPTSPDTSSKRLLWRPCDHACRRHSLCPERREQEELRPAAPPPSPRFFTLNANIQPFASFSIRHDLCGDQDMSSADFAAAAATCSAVNLTLCSDPDQNEPVEVLPDGQGLKYKSRVEIPEEGAEACLEVRVQRDGSTITTRRTGSSDCTSNEISVQLVDGGSRVNIQHSQVSRPLAEKKPERPASLHLPVHPPYATLRPQSLSQAGGRGVSPLASPRYNSLPNLKGLVYEQSGSGTWGYQSHPRDEEKRLAYTRALLSHQMEQLFKLESSLRQEREERADLLHQVRQLEEKCKRKNVKASNLVEVEVKQLEQDISNLRGECDLMSMRVTNLTGGKVPLGETSINFADYLKVKSSVPEQPAQQPEGWREEPTSDRGCREEAMWVCTMCTFRNHPSLEECEMCDMSRILIGSGNCFCPSHNPAPPPSQPLVRPAPRHHGDKVFSSGKCGATAADSATTCHHHKYNNLDQ